MRHFVNYALLFFILILATTGLLRFFEPFDLLTTRIHIIFGFGVILLVLLHLVDRLKYFKAGFQRRSKKGLPSRHLLSALIIAVILLCSAIWDWWPARSLIALGYEAQNKATIFRTDSSTAFKSIATGAVLMHAPEGSAHVRLEVEWGSAFMGDGDAQIAIWAENTTGMMINTFFVSEKCAYSEKVMWEGKEQPRATVLPVWRNRYTLLSGVDPIGKLDGKTAATPKHSFSIEEYLQADSSPFYIYTEVNLAGDNQPSILYGAYIEATSPKEYYLLPLVAHSGNQEEPSGHLYYDLDELTVARDIVEKILVRVVRKWE